MFEKILARIAKWVQEADAPKRRATDYADIYPRWRCNGCERLYVGRKFTFNGDVLCESCSDEIPEARARRAGL